MSLKVIARFTTAGLLAAVGGICAHAGVIANAQISLKQLQIVPSAGTLTFMEPWMAEAFAQGQNSLGELDQNFDGPGSTASATGIVTYVAASGAGDANLVTAGASSLLHIPGQDLAAANGTGRGTLTSTFEITGGSGSVNVQYLANVTRILTLSTDAFGLLAGGEVVFTLSRDGNDVLFSDDVNSVGASSSFNSTISGTQSQSELLMYNTPYSLLVEVDAESQGINTSPEPATLGLTIVPLALAFGARRLKIFHRYFG